MKLLILLALASITDAGIFNISLANEASTGIVGNIRSMSAVITLPPCSFSSKTVSVTVTNSTGGPGPVQPSFEMPFCRFRRGLVSIVSNTDGVLRTLNLGYKVQNLAPDTEYNVVYQIGSDKSNSLLIKTILPVDYTSINEGFTGRSGAMIVITVILVIAMVLLIVLLIVSSVIRN